MTTNTPLPPRVVAAQRFQRRFAVVVVVSYLFSNAPLLLLPVNEPLAIGLWVVAMVAALAGPALVWRAPLKHTTQIIEAWKVAQHHHLALELRREALAAEARASMPPPLRLRA